MRADASSGGPVPPQFKNTHWAVPYIGRPWVAAAAGPDAFNCWSFFRWVQRARFGRDLPEIPNPEALLSQARLFRDHPERRRWRPVDAPAEGDAVLMGSARHPVHVGVWVAADGGKVLHCMMGAGVVAQDPPALADHGFAIKGYFRFDAGLAAEPPRAPRAKENAREET